MSVKVNGQELREKILEYCTKIDEVLCNLTDIEKGFVLGAYVMGFSRKQRKEKQI